MKRISTQLSIVAMAILFFSSCKREESLSVDQNRIYSDYSYIFDSETNKTTATAEFRMNSATGKKLELSYPAQVMFNNEVLAWRRLNGDYQVISYAAQAGGTFKYQDTEEQVYQNKALNLKSVEFPLGLTTISKNSDLFLPWNGGPINYGETVEVTIKAGTYKTFRANIVGGTYVTIDRNSLANLPIGPAEIEIERVSISPLEQSTYSGGRITSKYKGRPLNITITE